MESDRINRSDPAKAYTLTDFVDLRYNDNSTYRSFSILNVENGIEFVDHNLLDEYMEYLNKLVLSVELTDDEYLKYRYCPDLLAYDIYGSTQLDYVILKLNGMIDPKEFDKKTVKLIKTSSLQIVLNEIMQVNTGYIAQNREDNNIVI